MSYFELPAHEIPPQNNLYQVVAGFMGRIVTKYNCMSTHDLVALAMDSGCETADDFSSFLAPNPKLKPPQEFDAEVVYINERKSDEHGFSPLQIAS